MSLSGMTVLCGTAYEKTEAEERKAERAIQLSEQRKKQEQSLADYKINRVALIRAFDKIRHARNSR